MLKLLLVDAGVHADEKRLVHDDVGVAQITDHPVLDSGEGRLSQKVTAEQVARLDALRLEEARQIAARETGILAYGHHKPEPGGL